MRDDDEELGGDPPCWAHLFEDDDDADADADAGARYAIDAADLARRAAAGAVAASIESADLDVNLLIFAAGEGVPEHVNVEVDVLIVGMLGTGIVTVDGSEHRLGPGQALLVPKESRRGTRAESARFAYLTCHRRRGGLLPTARR
jgi:quercetin dioxygenase-like cupin family protein